MELEAKYSLTQKEHETLLPKLEDAEVHEMEAVYFDTPEGLFQEEKAGFRIRKDNGRPVATLKQDLRAEGAVTCRAEWECPLKEGTLAEAGEALHALAREDARLERLLSPLEFSRLEPLCRMRFTRRAKLIRRGEDAVELALDAGLFEERKAFYELELELKQGSDAFLYELEEALSKELSLRPQKKSKLLRCLEVKDGQC